MLKAEFNAGTSVVKLDCWPCFREEHQNDGFHYHCAWKLTGCKKWLSVKKRIAEKHGIQVNFNDKHNFCLSGYRYVFKSGSQWKSSSRAFDKKSIAGFHAAACATKKKSTEGESSCGVARKRERLTNLNLVEFIRDGGIKSYTELPAIAEERRTAGQMAIAEFVFKRNEKILHELVTKTWQMESAK